MTLHKEGIVSISATIIVLSIINAVLFQLFPTMLLLQQIVMLFSIILSLIVLQFFRNPSKVIEINENNIIAPADGKVVVIEEVIEDEFLNKSCRQISIFMSPFNVHVNRTPVGGIVRYFKYHPGKFLVAWHPKSSTENERTTCVVEMKNGTQILCRQIAGALARRIVWYVKEGIKINQGDEYGFIKFGSRVDIFIPLDAKVTVNLNQKTVGGKTIIATFK